MVRISETPIDMDRLRRQVEGPGAGAVITFAGTVRHHSLGRKVLYLVYEAYSAMAEKELEKLASLTRSEFDLQAVAIHHRTGRLEIGEVSLGIAIASAHRKPGLAAMDFLIDRIKTQVPIWKKEFWEGGEYWIEGNGVSEIQKMGAES